MTKALVAIHNTTYGGVYYSANINFADLTTQPTWTKLSVTGLANLLVKRMQNDFYTPYTDIYVQLDNDDVYRYNGVSWTSIMTLADAKTATGLSGADVGMGYVYVDKTTAGTVYIPIAKQVSAVKVLKSTDYGATWSVLTVGGGITLPGILAYVQAVGNYIAVCTSDPYRCVAFSTNGGALWSARGLWNNSAGGAPVKIDRHNPANIYYRWDSTDADLLLGNVSGTTQIQDGYSLATDIQGFEHSMWIDPVTSGHHRIMRGLSNKVAIFSTVDTWANFVDSTPTDLISSSLGHGALAAALENANYGMFGLVDSTSGGVTNHRVYGFIGDNPTQAYGISGANYNSSPYADSIPNAADVYVAHQGIFVGEAPASTGVYVYADEQGDITSLPDYDNLGTPLFGDRSSWRDLPADGFDIYHAEDVQRVAPQIHAPWDDASPPPAGYGIVSDGSKWVVSSDEIALDSDLHDPVTLDADAAVILDLNGQEIGLDVQNANTVLAGPASGAANEPTFRALTLANGDVTDVDITGAGTGDIIYKPAAGDWIDYPLGVGTALVNDGASIKMGDVADGDYLSVSTSTGEVTLSGEATAWEDLRVEPTVRQSAGVGVPTFEKWFDDTPGTSKGVYLYSFTDEAVAGNEKEIFFTMQMPHAWKLGSDISMHVHFVPAATVNSSDIIWGLEYTWKGIGEIYGDTTIIYSSTTLIPDDANITAGKHYLAEFADIAPGVTASSLSSILIGRLFRNSSSLSDTYTNKVGLLYIDAHYQVDSFGSFDEYDKSTGLTDSDGVGLTDSDGVELVDSAG